MWFRKQQLFTFNLAIEWKGLGFFLLLVIKLEMLCAQERYLLGAWLVVHRPLYHRIWGFYLKQNTYICMLCSLQFSCQLYDACLWYFWAMSTFVLLVATDPTSSHWKYTGNIWIILFSHQRDTFWWENKRCMYFMRLFYIATFLKTGIHTYTYTFITMHMPSATGLAWNYHLKP